MSSETRDKYLHKGLLQDHCVWYFMQIRRNTYLRIQISQTFTLFWFHSACQILNNDRHYNQKDSTVLPLGTNLRRIHWCQKFYPRFGFVFMGTESVPYILFFFWYNPVYPEIRKPYQAPNQIFKDSSFLLQSGWPSPCLGKREPSGPGNASPAFFQTAVINLSLSTTLPKDTIKIHICVFSPEGKPSEISRVLEVFWRCIRL